MDTVYACQKVKILREIVEDGKSVSTGAVKEVHPAERSVWATANRERAIKKPEKRKKEPDGIPTEPSGCYTEYMKTTLPTKDYSRLYSLNQLYLPMDVGVLIPKDDSVRLLVFVLTQLDLKPFYEAYNAYREQRRREDAARERTAAERDAGKLLAADEAEHTDTQPNQGTEKKKEGRPPCDIMVLLRIILYGYMQGIYSTRGIAQACIQNINFRWLLNGNPPPSHGMIHLFRKHLFSVVIEKLFYELVQFLGRCGEVTFGNCFIDGTMLEAQANRYTAVWRKNLDRYEQGQKEKGMRIAGAINEQAGTGFSEDGQRVEETVGLVRAYINDALESDEGEGSIPRRTLKEYRKELKECMKKLQKYRKQREIMGNRNSYSKIDTDATFMRMKDETLKAAYNVQVAVEGEYITGAGIFANPNDGTNLKPFLEHLKEMLGRRYENITADAGYESELTVYESEGCEGCPVRERCTTSPKNRRLEVSKKLLALRGESEANIKSDEGILLRVNRSIQVEGGVWSYQRGPPLQAVFHPREGWGKLRTVSGMFWLQCE